MYRRLAIALAVAGVVVLGIKVTMRQQPDGTRLDELPATVRGVWMNDEPLFAGDSWEFGATTITLGFGEVPVPEEYDIRRVFSTADDTAGDLYYVEYGDGLRAVFRFHPRKQEVRFESRPHVVWRREREVRRLLAERAAAERQAERKSQAQRRETSEAIPAHPGS